MSNSSMLVARKQVPNAPIENVDARAPTARLASVKIAIHVPFVILDFDATLASAAHCADDVGGQISLHFRDDSLKARYGSHVCA